MKRNGTMERTMKASQLGQLVVNIGGIVATVSEHVAIFKEEGQSDRCIDYFIGKAIERAM